MLGGPIAGYRSLIKGHNAAAEISGASNSSGEDESTTWMKMMGRALG